MWESGYLSFVRFSHSVFALPFALTGALLAWREQPFAWSQVAWIVVHGQREERGDGFNRLVDARMDALNLRMAMRELPRGLLSKPEATVFVIVAAVVFVFAASRLSPLCLALAPVALMIVFGITRWPSGSRHTRRCFSASRLPSRRSAGG